MVNWIEMVVFGSTQFLVKSPFSILPFCLAPHRKSPAPAAAPKARLSSIQRQLAEQMPAASEGMRRAVKCVHGSQMLSGDTIAAMLPEEVGMVEEVDAVYVMVFPMGLKNGIETWDVEWDVVNYWDCNGISWDFMGFLDV